MKPISRIDYGIKFEVVYHDSDMLELRIHASNGSYTGTCDLYAGDEQLEEFVSILSGFPVTSADKRQYNLGAPGPGYAGGALHLSFSCSDNKGHAIVEVEIISTFETSQLVSDRAHFSIPIEAAAIDLFIPELRLLIKNRNGTAILQGVVHSS